MRSIKMCDYCSENFQAKTRRARYCCGTCRRNAFYKTKLAKKEEYYKYRRKEKKTGNCRNCGKQFEGRSGKLFCSDTCRAKHSRNSRPYISNKDRINSDRYIIDLLEKNKIYNPNDSLVKTTRQRLEQKRLVIKIKKISHEKQRKLNTSRGNGRSI